MRSTKGYEQREGNQVFWYAYSTQSGWYDSTTGFNEKGVIQNAWLERGGKENVYPEADDWYVVQSSGGRRQLICSRMARAMMKGNDREAEWI